MKILCINNGIEIKFGNETNIETVFGLDNNNEIIQNTTFKCDISIINELNFKNTINNSFIQKIDNGYLFYSFRYEISFAHYITQTVPKLYEYLNLYNNYKLLIPKHRYNNLCKDILYQLNINDSQIVLLDENVIYEINDYIVTPCYDAIPCHYTNNHLWVYKKIRESLSIEPNIQPKRKIYLKRDGFSNDNFGNSETGIKRQIYNEDELINVLLNLGFEIITLGNKHLHEKMDLLNNASIIITPLGANCMNFIFCNAPKNILYLSNECNFGDDYYTSLCEELNNTKINYKVLRYNGVSTDPLNMWNKSFSADINEIISNISIIYDK
jgi:capsular polysaccharide biosynthesis protein